MLPLPGDERADEGAGDGVRRAALVKLALALGTPVVALLGVEAVARHGLFGLVPPGLGEKPERIADFRNYVAGRDTGLYEPKAYVGFTLNRRSEGINSRGFRDGEFPTSKTEGVLRVACLGASTTEGSMAEGGGSYPHHLGLVLKRETGAAAEVLNFGVSGWTSAESLANWCLVVQDYAPDVVVVHHAINDVRPRLWPNYRPDYSHYRRPWSPPSFGDLERALIEHSDAFTAWTLSARPDWSLNALVNVPASTIGPMDTKELRPETARGFVRNLRSLVRLVRASGAVPILTTMPLAPGSPFYENPFGRLVRAGVVEHNRLIRELAAEEGVVLVDLDAEWRAEPGRFARHFIDHVHVTSEGNREKAFALAERITSEDFADASR